MPKETFYHLNVEKRENIEKALEHELERVSFEKVSISNIVQEAKIPRGSFYQYFENKEDAIKYVIEKYRIIEIETVKRILVETKGNIFEAALKIFDYVTSEIQGSPRISFYKNVMQELKKNNINLFNNIEENEEIKEMNHLVDTSILDLKEKEELKYIMKIISTIVRTESINVCTANMTIKDARLNLEKQIEILKRGMIKACTIKSIV